MPKINKNTTTRFKPSSAPVETVVLIVTDLEKSLLIRARAAATELAGYMNDLAKQSIVFHVDIGPDDTGATVVKNASAARALEVPAPEVAANA